VSWVRENRTPSSTGGRWKRGDPVGHPRVPGRCAEKRHHDGLVGTQPTDQSLPRQRSTLLTFAPRSATNKLGETFVSFSPAASNVALKAFRHKIRRWRLHRWVSADLRDLAEMINPVVRGWVNYYGRFYRTKLFPTLSHINGYLIRWAKGKYKRLRRRQARAHRWLISVATREPDLFVHWQQGARL